MQHEVPRAPRPPFLPHFDMYAFEDLQHPNFGAVGSVEVGSTDVKGETLARRLRLTKDALRTQPWEGFEVVPDILDFVAKTHGPKDAYGWRDVITIHEEVKEVKKLVNDKEISEMKTWKYYELSDYKYISFYQVRQSVYEVAGGLLELGIEKSDIFHIYAATRCAVLVYYFSAMDIVCSIFLQPSLAVHLTRMLPDRDSYCYRLRYPWRSWPPALIERARMRRNVYQRRASLGGGQCR